MPKTIQAPTTNMFENFKSKIISLQFPFSVMKRQLKIIVVKVHNNNMLRNKTDQNTFCLQASSQTN